MDNKENIYKIRNQLVLLDRDLALCYSIETKTINRQVKRHHQSFSDADYFQLTKEEYQSLWYQNGTANKDINISKKSRSLPYAFTLSGIEKLSLIFKKPHILEINKSIIRAIEKQSTALIFPHSELKNKVLTYTSEDGSVYFDVKIDDDTLWLTQQQIAELFKTTQQNISFHLSNIFDESELQKESVHKYYLYTAQDGKDYKTIHYNLDAILSVGYRINSKIGTHFRQWATQILKAHLLDGHTIKDRYTNLVVHEQGERGL